MKTRHLSAAITLAATLTGFGQAPGTKLWEFKAMDTVFSSPAIGSDGTLYFGSNGESGNPDRFFAVNPDGTKKWDFPVTDVFSSPAIGADGTIYFGTGNQLLYALNPDGTKKWEFATGASISSSPAVGADGTIYFGSQDYKFYAVDPTGTKKWDFTTGLYVVSSAAIAADGTICFGSLDHKLYALSPDGTKKWEFTTGHEIHSSPAIAADGTIYASSYDGKLYALKPDGTQKWAASNGGGDSSPAIGPDGAIYIGRGFNLVAFSSSGTQKWVFATTDRVTSSPAVAADGTIYFGSDDHKVYAVNPGGTKQWDFLTGNLFLLGSPTLAADGTVYIGSGDGKLYALKGTTGPAASSWPMFRHDNRHTGSVPTEGPPRITSQPRSLTVMVGSNVTMSVTAIGALPLTYQWRRNGTSLLDGGNISGATSATLAIANAQLTNSGNYSIVLSNSAGTATSDTAVLTVLEHYIVPGTKLWEFTSGGSIYTSPAVGQDGTIYFGADDQKLYAVSAAGTNKWSFRIGTQLQSSPAVGPDGTVYIGSVWPSNRLYAVAPDGAKRWEVVTGGPIRTTPAIGRDGTVFFTSGEGKLYAVGTNGLKQWEFVTTGIYQSSPAIGREGTIYVGAGHGDPVLGYDVGEFYAIYPDGTLKWKFTARGPFTSPPAIGTNGVIYFGSSDNEGKLYAFNRQGHKQWEYRTGASINNGPVIDLDGTIYVANMNQALFAIAPEGKQKWTFPTGASASSPPAIANDGTLYFGSGDGNLYALNSAGVKQWAFLTLLGNNGSSAPALGPNGEIYFGSWTKLYAVQGSGPLATNGWPMFHHDLRHTAGIEGAIPIPTVIVTIPTNDATYLPGQNITIDARAFGGAGPIDSVDFYAGTNLLGRATNSPYSLTWSNVASGVYVLTAVVRDQAGTEGLSGEVNVVVNAPPLVTLTYPTNGAVYIERYAIALSATVSDPDTALTKVDFYQGTNLLGTVPNSPYQMIWENVSAGRYVLTARATDILGAIGVSDGVAVLVDARPTVIINSPNDGATFEAGTNILVAASASDSDGTISRVEFYNGLIPLGSSAEPPYTFTLNNAAVGNYTLLAAAVDNLGAVGVSAAVAVSVVPTNKPPGLSFDEPFDGAIFVLPTEIQLSASASDPDGLVAKLEFFANQDLLASFATNSATYSWTNVAPGNYLLAAKATDNRGALTSKQMRIEVVETNNLPPPAPQPGSAPRANFWVPDGPVNAILETNGVVYVGGSFNNIGQLVPGGAVVELSADSPDLSYPLIDGFVNILIGDGEGGYYLGGLFKAVGDVARTNLAHVRSDKSLDIGFRADTDTHVTALTLLGDTLFVGGEFKRIGGRSHRFLAALDKRTGTVKDWNPDPDVWVSALAAANNTVYVGGNFRNIGGQPRAYIAAVDATTGLAAGWNPGADDFITQFVIAQDRIYAVGRYHRIGGQLRNGLAALDLATGIPDGFNQLAEGGASAVSVIGNTVYVAGTFGRMGGVDRNNLAALEAQTGEATSWNPNANGAIEDMVILGDTVYVAGLFTQINGQSRNRFAALDRNTGLVSDLDLNASGRIVALSESAGKVLGAGSLDLIRLPRKGLAAIDAATGFATGWNPQCDGEVFALASKDDALYVGGGFSSLGGQRRDSIGAVDVRTARATPWNPGPTAGVRALTVLDNTVFVGGFFNGIGGQLRNYLAAVDATTGEVMPWNPNPNDGTVTISVFGDRVYVGGNFTQIGGQPRNYLAALNLFTGKPTAWNPNPNGLIRAVAVRGNVVYAAGGFNGIGGKPRRFIAALDAETGVATGWSADADGGVLALAATEDLVYAGGQFTMIGGQLRINLAALDPRLKSPNATAWNPKPGSEGTSTVNTLETTTSTLYVGGNFRTVDGRGSPYLAAFDLPARAESPLHLPNGLFRVNLIGPLGRIYVFEASTDLTGWIPVFTNRAPFIFEDVDAINYPHRFYRAVPLR